jgi:hypothetical protein
VHILVQSSSNRKENGMHDALTIGVPVLAILLGILLNQRGLERLELCLRR